MNRALRDVPSPCVQVCQMDPASGFCRGCGRTLQEIADWLEMSAGERLATLERAAARRERNPNRD